MPYLWIANLPPLQIIPASLTDSLATVPERIEIELDLLREYESSEVEISEHLNDANGEPINISLVATMERQYE